VASGEWVGLIQISASQAQSPVTVRLLGRQGCWRQTAGVPGARSRYRKACCRWAANLFRLSSRRGWAGTPHQVGGPAHAL